MESRMNKFTSAVCIIFIMLDFIQKRRQKKVKRKAAASGAAAFLFIKDDGSIQQIIGWFSPHYPIQF